MKDAAQEAVNILGDAVQQMQVAKEESAPAAADPLQETIKHFGKIVRQMQAARDKPRDDPEAVMEAALRRILDTPVGLVLDDETECACIRCKDTHRVAREAIRKVEAWRASE